MVPIRTITITIKDKLNLDKFISKFSGFSESYKFYNDTIEIVYDKENHVYLLVDGTNLIPQPSVTNIVKASVDKSEILLPWACKVMGEKLTKLIPHFPFVLTEEQLQQLIYVSKKAHKEKLDEAGMVGNMAHNFIENIIKSQLKDPKWKFMDKPADPRAVSAIDAALSWMKAHNVRWICTERKIYSKIHKYAGTMDGLAWTDSCTDPLCCPVAFKDRKSIIDWKTSNNLYLDYLFQEAAYRGAYLEEHPDETIEDGWVIRLGKEDAEFDPWHIWDESEFEMYYYGFLNARRWYESMNHAKEQVKIKDSTLREARKEQRKKLKEEELKLKCKSADKYKAVRRPICNSGSPCEACINKWNELHPLDKMSRI